jgi:hypothetical protein
MEVNVRCPPSLSLLTVIEAKSEEAKSEEAKSEEIAR